MGSSLVIKCFGDFRVELNGKVISTFETDKTRALLVYLALESNHPLRRSHIAGVLWSDETEEHALHNLRQTLSYLRKALGEHIDSPQFIIADRETIFLNLQADVWIDCIAFTRALANAFRHYQSQIGVGFVNYRLLTKAIVYFDGDFLSYFPNIKSVLFEEWMMLLREEFNLQAIKALSLLVEYHERRQEYHQAIEMASRIVDLCPWDESNRNHVIQLLGVDQQWSAAKSQYYALKRYFADQLSVSPSRQTEALYEQICDAAEGKSKIEPKISPHQYCLPQNQITFVGREAEIDQITELLVSPEYRLITIVGLGGIGKSRFAIEIAKQFVGVFPDGIFFVPLVSAKEYEQIITLIAESLGILFSDQTTTEKQLLDHLRDKKVLLILDNFEHLLDNEKSINFLDDILSSAHNLKILVTSREHLYLEQAHVYLLSGLCYPQDMTIPINEIDKYDALRLFFKRATQKQPGFTLDENNLPSIIKICRVLEGLPLGIELAVATICEQGSIQVVEKYGDDLGTLTTRMSNVQSRHRSLNAAFEVSWDNLSDNLKQIFYCLSVFSDGFDAIAAETVAEASLMDLALLVSKSLIRKDQDGRFSLHEAIRQFAGKKELANLNLPKLREKHARYYVKFLVENHSGLLNDGQTEALLLIQKEFGNITLCWNWITEQKCSSLLMQSMDSLFHYFNIRSLFEEGISWFKRAVNCLEAVPESELALGMLLWRMEAMAFVARDNELMMESLMRSQDLLSNFGDWDELAYCRIHLGWVYQREKDFNTAQVYAEQALAYFSTKENDLGLTQVYLLVGSIENRQGNFYKSQPFFEQALYHCRKTKNPRNLVIVLNRLADIICYEGKYDDAIALFQESLKISDQLNDRYHQAVLLNNLGTIAHLQCHYQLAKTYYDQSLSITRDIGDLDGTAFALNNLGELATCQKEYQLALHYSEEALDIAQKLHENWTIIVCLNSLGEIYCGLELLEKSKQYYRDAIKLAVEINGLDLVARVMINLARVYQLTGETEKAISYLLAAVSHSATEQDSREKASTWLKESGVVFDGKIRDDLINEMIAHGELIRMP